VLETAATGAWPFIPGRTEFVKLALLAGGNPNVDSARGTPFIDACLHAEPSAVRLMLEAGADVNKRCNVRTPSPIAAAVESQFEEPFFAHVERGADVTLDDGLIHAATRGGHAKVVAYLLEHSARRESSPDDHRATDLLSEAITHGEPGVVRVLLEHGFKPGAIDAQGRMPASTHLELAAKFNQHDWQLKRKEGPRLSTHCLPPHSSSP
jgi:hypothetical protein